MLCIKKIVFRHLFGKYLSISIRFSDGENAIIHRLGVGENGLIEHKWARGAWDKAESLVYDKEIDETMEVDA